MKTETPAQESKRCGAKLRSGKPCRKWGMQNGRCRLHGGLTPKGFDLPQTTHGRYSKYLPTGLLAKFNAAMADPDLLNQTGEIALIDARLAELLEKIGTGENGVIWKALREANDRLRAAQAKSDAAGMASALNDISRLIEQGQGESAVWTQIDATLENRRKFVDSETRRIYNGQMILRLDEATQLIQTLGLVVRQYVTDPQTLAAIQTEFARIMGTTTQPRLSAPTEST